MLKNNILTAEQQEALKWMESGRNVFLSGKAGTGKSYLLEEYVKRNTGKKNIIVCAPTGMAAANIQGVTIHRLFKPPYGIIEPGKCNIFPDDAICAADVVIIDEISMCRIDLFEFVIQTIRYVEEQFQKHIQVIAVGDFLQLPPVLYWRDKEQFNKLWQTSTEDDLFAFKSQYWWEQNFVNCLMKEVVRQDDSPENISYKEQLNSLREGQASSINWFNSNTKFDVSEDAVYLCGRKDDAKRINDQRTAELNTASKTYYATMTGDIKTDDKRTDEALLLKIGMKVMILVNNDQECYQNGSLGIVETLGDDYIEVRLNDDRLVRVNRFKWPVYSYRVVNGLFEKYEVASFEQIPVVCAYAIIIHKAQGQTFDAVHLNPRCFAPGQLYVALSRTKNFKNLSLIDKIQYLDLKVSQVAVRFYNDLECAEAYDNPFDIDVTAQPEQFSSYMDSCTPSESSHSFNNLTNFHSGIGLSFNNDCPVAPPPGKDKTTKKYFVKNGDLVNGPFSINDIVDMAKDDGSYESTMSVWLPETNAWEKFFDRHNFGKIVGTFIPLKKYY